MRDGLAGLDGRKPPSRAPGLALGAYVVAVVVAIPVLFHAGRDQWFFVDEWDFIAGRDLASPHDLLRPHNEHWTTLPAVAYRLIFQVVGARVYWPYLIPVVAAHLVAVSLLRVVMRRAGADPWIATAGCIAYLYLGAGREDLVWGFQITFTGALALGLASVVLADRSGRLGLRDAAAVGAGVGALACSAIGVAMVGTVVVACALRCEWRRAVVHLAVPAVVFGAWTVAFRTEIPRNPVPGLTSGGAYVGWMLVDAGEGLGRNPVIAGLLAVATAVGFVAAGRALTRPRPTTGAVRWRAQADVVALVVGAGGIAVGTACTRAGVLPVTHGAVPGRYVHLLVGLALPALVVGLTAGTNLLAGGGRQAGVVVAAALVLAGLPANAADLEPEGPGRITLGNEPAVLTFAAVAIEQETPPEVVAFEQNADEVTAGWLQRATALGDLPVADRPLDPDLAATASVTLSFALDDRPAGPACPPLRAPVDLLAGDVVTAPSTSITVAGPHGGGLGQATFRRAPGEASLSLRALRPLHLGRADAPGAVIRICRAR